MPIPTRRLPINGGYNYRDLGGYPTLDGHTIKWRRLLQSAPPDQSGSAILF